ncbi:MAG: helix-hairpin-helix domain-containing protein [Ruminococcus sp.]|jgi:DNA uptake protein ComE-like DNA-binding protein|nr:helix-hairpin-helix domain-containing protein [Ruminococcus sp.]
MSKNKLHIFYILTGAAFVVLLTVLIAKNYGGFTNVNENDIAAGDTTNGEHTSDTQVTAVTEDITAVSIYYINPYKSSTKPVTTTVKVKTPRRVNLNTATYEDLIQLPGMNEVLANNILNLRKEIGRFSHTYEVLYAEGMTESLAASLMPYIYI